jgi:hypothetical protein
MRGHRKDVRWEWVSPGLHCYSITIITSPVFTVSPGRT